MHRKFKFCFLELFGIFSEYIDLLLVEPGDVEPADNNSQWEYITRGPLLGWEERVDGEVFLEETMFHLTPG